MSTETDDEFLKRMESHPPRISMVDGHADYARLIALARRGLTAREDALEEAAKVAATELQSSHSSRVHIAAAIRVLKEKKP
jgi:hypothetical protein